MSSFHPTLVKLETTRDDHARSARRALRAQRESNTAEAAAAEPKPRRMPLFRRAKTA